MSFFRVPVTFEGGRVRAPLVQAPNPVAARAKAGSIPWGRGRRVLAVGQAVLIEVAVPRTHRCPICKAIHESPVRRRGMA